MYFLFFSPREGELMFVRTLQWVLGGYTACRGSSIRAPWASVGDQFCKRWDEAQRLALLGGCAQRLLVTFCGVLLWCSTQPQWAVSYLTTSGVGNLPDLYFMMKHSGYLVNHSWHKQSLIYNYCNFHILLHRYNVYRISSIPFKCIFLGMYAVPNCMTTKVHFTWAWPLILSRYYYQWESSYSSLHCDEMFLILVCIMHLFKIRS